MNERSRPRLSEMQVERLIPDFVGKSDPEQVAEYTSAVWNRLDAVQQYLLKHNLGTPLTKKASEKRRGQFENTHPLDPINQWFRFEQTCKSIKTLEDFAFSQGIDETAILDGVAQMILDGFTSERIDDTDIKNGRINSGFYTAAGIRLDNYKEDAEGVTLYPTSLTPIGICLITLPTVEVVSDQNTGWDHEVLSSTTRLIRLPFSDHRLLEVLKLDSPATL